MKVTEQGPCEPAMTNLQTEYTEAELLATGEIAEPLVAGGVRCHGGFDDEGRYVSPRTANRVPAIEAWQAQHAAQFNTELLAPPLSSWPEHYPNVAQAKLLIGNGAQEPVITTLTRIGTVEGFGAMIRHSLIPDLEARFVEDVRGTAMSHLGRGLYEAHARDEAGFDDEGGHKQMWFAARDVGFEHPVTEDETATMLARMGIVPPGSPGAPAPTEVRRQLIAGRVLPDDIDFDLELLVERMTRLLLIEVSAFHTFAWAEEVLSDADLVAGEGEAARLVSYIRADETPHVEYLRTTLSEMRDRTWVGESGRRYPGSEMVGRIYDKCLVDSLGVRRHETLRVTLTEVELALAGHRRGGDILEAFHAAGSIRPGPDGAWVSAE
jgi:hypothetical protein